MARTIFVVGSSSGIGLAIVKLFFSEGWNVAAGGRNPDASKDLQDLRSQDPQRLLLVSVDLTNPDTFQPALDAVNKAHGGINVLVNNAGINIMGLFELLPQEKLRRQFEVNFFGPAHITRLAIPSLRSSAKSSGKESLIINISSGGGHYATPLFSNYMSSKFAFEGLMESLHHELSAQHIIVKNVIPTGGVKDTKLGEAGFPEADPFLVDAFMSQRRDLSGEPPEKREALATYQEYTEKSVQKLMTVSDRVEGAPYAADIAKVALEAVEDGTRKFRYFIGQDISPLHKAKFGGRPDDEEYMEQMRQFFA
ncbi:short-chain dehydrogenase reductase SDR [Xylogone sp. PMI_703]|nr:short-chain dehydrogenase reductase SDR [Xylogone sp. PMI_703]